MCNNDWSSYIPDGVYDPDTRRKMIRNIERALTFDESMFRWRSRHLILVLTLGYKTHWQGFVTLDDLRRDRDALFNNIRSNLLLLDIFGYIWKIEEGDTVGVHMHIVIYFNGRKCNDIYYAEELCNYWNNVVTKGRGKAVHSNGKKGELEASLWGDATGQIGRHNSAKREALRTYLARYLCKPDQQVVSRTNPHCRMFGTSELPNVDW